jgi:hypothetical protein
VLQLSGYEYRFVSAIDGRNLEDTHQSLLTAPVEAIWKSHNLALKHFLTTHSRYCLILEDDFFIKDRRKFDDLVKKLLQEDFDLVQIGWLTTGLDVANGGIGRASQTAYAVICGGTTTTAAQQSIASVGTAGQVLTSNGAGALPTFQAAGGGFATGTAMMFVQTAAPTGWTKSITHDNKALRIVSGTASSGGSVAFTTAFASQTPAGSVAVSAISGSAGATTLTTPQIPSHTHPGGGGNNSQQASPGMAQNVNGAASTGPAGGGGSHTHPFSFTSGTASFTGTAINLAVQYVDAIIATKD